MAGITANHHLSFLQATIWTKILIYNRASHFSNRTLLFSHAAQISARSMPRLTFDNFPMIYIYDNSFGSKRSISQQAWQDEMADYSHGGEHSRQWSVYCRFCPPPLIEQKGWGGKCFNIVTVEQILSYFRPRVLLSTISQSNQCLLYYVNILYNIGINVCAHQHDNVKNRNN